MVSVWFIVFIQTVSSLVFTLTGFSITQMNKPFNAFIKKETWLVMLLFKFPCMTKQHSRYP